MVTSHPYTGGGARGQVPSKVPKAGHVERPNSKIYMSTSKIVSINKISIR